ncbi:MAG: gamma-glutamylcyclotransferase [Anaerolineales bacterium]|nr:gamma-glutamylcyclotransferase [Anaerolineales bacterium]
MNSYIFAYGGLILAESRAMTLGAASEATAVILNGFERFWGFAAPAYGLTSLSLRINQDKKCAGVLFPITAPQLALLDVREEGYERVMVAAQDINPLAPLFGGINGRIFTYIAETENAPSTTNPIVQSEVDAILTGCLREHGEPFAREVVQTTSGWQGSWLNDRQAPRFPFSNHDQQFVTRIDRLLAEVSGFRQE